MIQPGAEGSFCSWQTLWYSWTIEAFECTSLAVAVTCMHPRSNGVSVLYSRGVFDLFLRVESAEETLERHHFVKSFNTAGGLVALENDALDNFLLSLRSFRFLLVQSLRLCFFTISSPVAISFPVVLETEVSLMAGAIHKADIRRASPVVLSGEMIFFRGK